MSEHAWMLSLHSVGYDYGRVAALRDITLSVQRGERVAFVGANGSGKSTLLRLMHGLIAPTHGAFARVDSVRQAMVFQRPFMLRASVRTNVLLGLWLSGVRGSSARERCAQALAHVGLSGEAERPARSLSGGQQQRLALARALALRPDLILLDEPTASLDPTAKREVEALIEDFAVQGITVLMSSHNLGQVKRLATRVIYLEHGRVLADSPTDRFFAADAPSAAVPFLKGELPW